MKLVRVGLRNFRCYKEEISFDLGDLVMFVGRNDIGKSSVFDALNIFFGETKPDQGDASTSGDPTDVRIICEFDELPEGIILDSDYQTNLKDEYILNGLERLEVHQVWNCSLKTPKAAMYANACHPSAEGYNDLLELTNKDLKKRAAELQVDLNGIDVKINANIRAAIWSSAADLKFENRIIQLDKDNGKKIWDQLKLKLPVFSLFKADRESTDADPEAQDPMNSAMKEAFKGLESELEAIVEKVKDDVQEIANSTVQKLNEMHPDLAKNLIARFSEPNWTKVLKVDLLSDDNIPLNKRGSGVRRLVLINFFRAKAESAAFERGDSVPVIYAIEEPETSQHPTSQRLLLNALVELSETPGRQVFFTSHNPVIARRIPSGSIRYICDDNGVRCSLDIDGTAMQRLVRDLGVLPDHDVKLFIGVEGPNDINFMKNMSSMLICSGIDVPNLSELEEVGHIIFIPCGGSNLSLWIHRLSHLNRPEFHLFDGDKPEYKILVEEINQRDGCVGFCTEKLEMENYIHPNAIVAVRPELDGINFNDRDDVPFTVAKMVHARSGSDKQWDDLDKKTHAQKMASAKKWLNREAVLAMSPDMLAEWDIKGEVRKWFATIADLIAKN